MWKVWFKWPPKYKQEVAGGSWGSPVFSGSTELCCPCKLLFYTIFNAIWLIITLFPEILYLLIFFPDIICWVVSSPSFLIHRYSSLWEAVVISSFIAFFFFFFVLNLLYKICICFWVFRAFVWLLTNFIVFGWLVSVITFSGVSQS